MSMLSWVEETLADLRIALRGMRRNPTFAVAGVVAASLGIGASAAVFSAVDRVLFRALPYRDEAQLVSVGLKAPLDNNEFLFADSYLDLQRHPGPFSGLTAFEAGSRACDLTEQSPLRLDCMRFERNFLELLGVPPAAGRAFTREEDLPNGPPVAMISYALWQSRFGADPRVAGRTLMLDGAPVTITGVLPANFLLPTLAHADVYLPMNLDEARERQGRAFRVFGRLKPGVTVEAARSELAPFFQRALLTAPAQFRKEITLAVRSVRDRQLGDARLASLALFGAVLAVLLIACANLANLLLARGSGRDREMAVRAALGASRRRLTRQVLTESTLLGVLGGGGGVVLAFALLRAFRELGPSTLPRLEEAAIDSRVLAFSVAGALLSGLAAGLAAIRHPEGTAALGGTRTTASGRGRLRGILVTAQIAVSLVLLAGAGLLLRSLWNLENVPMGMRGDHVVTAQFSLGRQRYGDSARQLAFYTRLDQRLATLPGAQAVAITDSLPPKGGSRGRLLASIQVEGQPPRPQGTGGMVAWRYVTPGYFSALGIPMRRGRAFTDEDRAPAAYSIILTETLAKMLFPGEDPVGRRLLFLGGHGERFTVAGVAADVRERGPATEIPPEFYVVRKGVPDVTWNNQEPPMGWRSGFVVMRTPLDTRFAAAELRQAMAEIDPTLPVTLGTMRDRIESVTQNPRFYATLLGSFAAIGALLAALGLFGVISFLVQQSRREIGVRMALGAAQSDVVRHVLGSALRWTGAGLAIGIPGALAVSRGLRSLLFQVAPNDPASLAAAAAALVCVAVMAAAGPAWRAARLDPARTLRQE
jgi:predicted permease